MQQQWTTSQCQLYVVAVVAHPLTFSSFNMITKMEFTTPCSMYVSCIENNEISRCAVEYHIGEYTTVKGAISLYLLSNVERIYM